MKSAHFVLWLLGGLILFLVLLTGSVGDVQALPEYSAQTGEPCATCHISPSGGGVRTPRGQAWIASEKPGSVPDLLSSLEILGVTLTMDLNDYTDIREEMPPAMPLDLRPGVSEGLHQHLSDYPGN